jgi:hypothetical protein
MGANVLSSEHISPYDKDLLLLLSPSIMRVIKARRMRWAGHVARMGEVRSAFWLGSLNGGDHWEDLGMGWEDNIKMDLGEMGFGDADWIRLAQDRYRW